jgi:hypothetical protein
MVGHPAGSLSFEDVPGATTNWSVDGNNILTESDTSKFSLEKYHWAYL